MSETEYNDPDLKILMERKAKTTTREDLVEEIETLHSALHDAIGTNLNMIVTLKECRRVLEILISGEGERPKRDHYFSNDLARLNAMIIECLGRAKGGA